MNVPLLLLNAMGIKADLMSEYDGRRMAIINAHNDSEMLATDGTSVYLTDDDNIQKKSLRTDFEYKNGKFIVDGKTLCGFGSPDMTLQLCKYIFRNREWQFIYTGTNEAKLLNKETSKCLGYSDNIDKDQALPLVYCDSKDYETIFKIEFLDQVEEKMPYRPQKGPVNLFTNRTTAYRVTKTTKKITQNQYEPDFNRSFIK